MIINIHCRGENELLENGKLDEQIVADLEAYLEDRRKYQAEHLDARVKGVSHHYDSWTHDNQAVIQYTERLLACVKAQMQSN